MKKPRVADAFARAVIERDFAQAYDLTTLGLRARTDLRNFARTLVEAEAHVAPPGRYRLDGTAISFPELAESARLAGYPLPEDLHGDNFVCWLCINFLPGPDDESGIDTCYDFWCVVVEEDGEERIAYFEIRPPE